MQKILFIITILVGLIKIANAQQVGALTADFDYSPKFITTTDLTITFTDKSTGSVEWWYWDFGDGTIVTTQNPSHTYAQSGIYQVSLTVGDNNGNQKQKILAIDARIFIPEFTYSSPSGKFISNEEIQFTDQTPNTAETWLWNFGDGTTSAEQNPKHIFTKIGTYSVKLTVTKLNITKSISKAITINPSKIKFTGQVFNAETKQPLKDMAVNLTSFTNPNSINEIFDLITLNTDANGNFSTTLDWEGKADLTVFIYDGNNRLFIPFYAAYKGFREELNVKCYLNGKDKFQMTPTYLGYYPQGLYLDCKFDIEWSYSIGDVDRLPYSSIRTGELGELRYTVDNINTPPDQDYLKWGYDCEFNVNPEGSFHNNDILPIRIYQQTQDKDYYTYVVGVYLFGSRPVNNINNYVISKRVVFKQCYYSYFHVKPYFVFVNNSDAVEIGNVTTIKDLSDPLDRLSKIDINWGDGTINTFNNGTDYPASRLFNHTYSSTGEFTITITVYDVGGWSGSTSAKCYVIGCPFSESEYTISNDMLIIASNTINKTNFNYDNLLSSYYPEQYKPYTKCIMAACNQITISPASLLGQTLGVPLTLRIIQPGSVIKSAAIDDNYNAEVEEETINSNTETEGISIYPNPASQYFTIKTTGKGELKSYELFNNTGNCVKRWNCTGNESMVDISFLGPGVYFVKLVTQGRLFNSKLIIQ